MKKAIWMAAGALVAVASLAVAGLAFAQTANPPAAGGYGPGAGMMGGRGSAGGMMGGWGQTQGYTGTVPMGPGMMAGTGRGQMGGYGRGGMMGGQLETSTGPLHTYMLEAFAAVLDISRADLDQQLAAGQTMYAIAAAKGLSQEQFYQAMQTAREQALAKATADGVLTADQAAWMQSHMGQRGGQAGAGTCPHFGQTAPTPAAPSN